jgi:cyclophilin family peptidyl-prolyl cis-trans isomerase
MNLIKNAVSSAIILLMLLSITICFGAETQVVKSSNPSIVIETTMGNITIELYADKAPKTVKNFMGYVMSGYYTNTIFHRIMKNFMIQAGGLTADLRRKPGLWAPIENEATNGLKNEVGTIAMARTSEINSATSQFFINTNNNTSLNHQGESPDKFGYAVFGKVTAGMDVVTKIENVPTGTQGNYQNVPKEVITIKIVRLVK